MNTDEIKQIDKRMDSIEGVIREMRRDQKEGFDRLSKEVEGLKSGIHGNEEHDQDGYRQRISRLEGNVSELKEFKKKILYLVSAITSIVTLVANALILLFKHFVG